MRFAEHVALEGQDPVVVRRPAPQHGPGRHHAAFRGQDLGQVTGTAGLARHPVIARVDEADELRALQVEHRIGAGRGGALGILPVARVAGLHMGLVQCGPVGGVTGLAAGRFPRGGVAAMAIRAAEDHARILVHRDLIGRLVAAQTAFGLRSGRGLGLLGGRIRCRRIGDRPGGLAAARGIRHRRHGRQGQGEECAVECLPVCLDRHARRPRLIGENALKGEHALKGKNKIAEHRERVVVHEQIAEALARDQERAREAQHDVLREVRPVDDGRRQVPADIGIDPPLIAQLLQDRGLVEVELVEVGGEAQLGEDVEVGAQPKQLDAGIGEVRLAELLRRPERGKHRVPTGQLDVVGPSDERDGLADKVARVVAGEDRVLEDGIEAFVGVVEGIVVAAAVERRGAHPDPVEIHGQLARQEPGADIDMPVDEGVVRLVAQGIVERGREVHRPDMSVAVVA